MDCVPTRDLTNANKNVHIDVHRLTRSNREGLWMSAKALALAILNIQNIIP
jgi:hypothetical protein